MFNRLSFLFLVMGGLLGYAFAGQGVKAQSALSTMLPNVMYQPGATVTLSFEQGAMGDTVAQVNCNVAQVIGDWVRCKSSDSFQEEREQRWFDMKRVVQIIKREK